MLMQEHLHLVHERLQRQRASAGWSKGIYRAAADMIERRRARDDGRWSRQIPSRGGWRYKAHRLVAEVIVERTDECCGLLPFKGHRRCIEQSEVVAPDAKMHRIDADPVTLFMGNAVPHE